MEENLNEAYPAEGEQDLLPLLGSLFELPQRDYTQYSPLTLAYLGDAVFDLIVRTVLVRRVNMQAEKLHKKASSLVCAPAQAEMIHKLLPSLTEEERAVYRRGRGSKPMHTAKNASREQYLEATGFEALVGYLYLQGRYKRLLELIRQAADL